MALFLDIGPDDELRIGDGAVVTLEHKSGRRARLKIIGTYDVRMTKKTAEPNPPAPSGERLDGQGP